MVITVDVEYGKQGLSTTTMEHSDCSKNRSWEASGIKIYDFVDIFVSRWMMQVSKRKN